MKQIRNILNNNSPQKTEILYCDGSQASLPEQERIDPLLEDAKKNNRASFELLTQVLYNMHADASQAHSSNGSHADAARNPLHTHQSVNTEMYRALCPEILHAFQARYGTILRMDVRPQIRAAVALTEDGKLHVDYLLGECPQIDPYLIECHHVIVEAERLLVGQARLNCLTMLYAVMKNLFWLVGRFHRGTDPAVDADHKVTIETIDQRLQMARRIHESAAQLRAQKYYLTGALGGSLILAFLIWFTTISNIVPVPFSLNSSAVTFISPTHVMPHLQEILIPSLICGGVGAIISVMMRMGAGNLLLNYEADRWLLAITGIFRPLVGAVFAVVLVVLVQSSFSPLPGPPASSLPLQEPEQTLGFYLLGFLAGFSERFAPDMLDITGRPFSKESTQSSK